MTGAERHTANLSLFDLRRKLSLGAIRGGHLVVEFSDRATARAGGLLGLRRGRPWAERRFLQCVDELKPELILLHFADLISNRALSEARRLAPGLVIADINIDPIDSDKNRRRLAMRGSAADALFVTTAEPALGRCVGQGGFAAYLPNALDASIETLRAYENDAPAFDLLLPVTDRRPRELGPERLAPAEALKRLAAVSPGLRLSTPGSGGQPKVFGWAYAEALASARAGWSWSRRASLPLYASDRMTQFFGCGLAVVQDRRAGFDRLFGAEEALFYDGLEDLAARLARLLADDAAARAMAEAGCARAWALFESRRVFDYLLAQLFEEGGAKDYEWPCERWGPAKSWP